MLNKIKAWLFKGRTKRKAVVSTYGVRVKILIPCGFGRVGDVITLSAPCARRGVENEALAFCNDPATAVYLETKAA